MIDPKEIDTVEECGTIDGKKIKLIKTIGGLHLAVNEADEKSPIAAYASHPAIVKYQLAKRYGARFHEAIAKNEGDLKTEAISFEKNLPQALKNSGYDIFCLKKGVEASFVVTADNIEVIKSEVNDIKIEDITIKNSDKYKEFIQNEGKEALIKSLKEYISGE